MWPTFEGVKKTPREKDFLLHLLKNIEDMVQSGGVNPFHGMSANDIWEGVTGMDRHVLTSLRRELRLSDNILSRDRARPLMVAGKWEISCCIYSGVTSDLTTTQPKENDCRASGLTPPILRRHSSPTAYPRFQER